MTTESALRQALQLIAAQDQGCGGNVTEAEAWRSAQAIARAALTAQAAPSEPAAPFAWYVYFPDEMRGEFCHDLDDLIDDLTNCRHDDPQPLYLRSGT
jgi:hypothetical protein